MTKPNRILITGVTSKVGMNLLSKLLSTTDAEIWLPIRKLPEQREPWERLKASSKLQNSELELDAYKKRIKVFSADLTKRQMGIRDEVFFEMKKKGVDEVFHLAADTDRRYFSKDRLYKVNFEGTQRLLNLCRQLRVKRINHLCWLYAAYPLTEITDESCHDYLNFLESHEDFNNLNEFVQQITLQHLIRRCKEMNMDYRVISSAYQLDIENFEGIHKRWFHQVICLIRALASTRKSLNKQQRARVVFPAAKTPIYMTSPRYVADVMVALMLEGQDTCNRFYHIFNERRCVRELISTALEVMWDVEIEFTEDLESIPFIERQFFKRSFVFFEYLMQKKSFKADPELPNLEIKYNFTPPQFDKSSLKALADRSYQLAQSDRSLRLPRGLYLGLKYGHRLGLSKRRRA